MSFEGKTAVVTGAASGIGREISRRLAADGAHVLVTDLDQAAVEAVAADIGGGAEGMVVDVSDAAQIQAAVDHVVTRHGRLDYIFNNAGVAIFGEVEALSLEDWDKIIDVNLRGVAYGTTIAYKQMVSQEPVEGGRGHIVNTASGAGLIPVPLQVHYCATKHGVVGLSKTADVEARPNRISVTAFCPGFIRTGMMENNTLLGSLEGRDAVSLVPIKPASVEGAVDRLLKGVRKRRGIVLAPFYVRLGWWLERFAPGLARRLHARTLSDLRKRAKRADRAGVAA